MCQPSITKIRLKITYLKLIWNLTGANELTNSSCYAVYAVSFACQVCCLCRNQCQWLCGPNGHVSLMMTHAHQGKISICIMYFADTDCCFQLGDICILLPFCTHTSKMFNCLLTEFCFEETKKSSLNIEMVQVVEIFPHGRQGTVYPKQSILWLVKTWQFLGLDMCWVLDCRCATSLSLACGAHQGQPMGQKMGSHTLWMM